MKMTEVINLVTCKCFGFVLILIDFKCFLSLLA